MEQNRSRKGPISARLGLKVRVDNNIGFDARQKLLKKKQQNNSPPKVRITNNLHDARLKISQKTKIQDARALIQKKKKPQAGAGPGAAGDMRIKINNAKAKKGQPQQQAGRDNVVRTTTQRNYDGATQVTVTGQGRLLTRPGGGVQEINGSLVKVITRPKQPVKTQGSLQTAAQRQNRFQDKPGAIRITKPVASPVQFVDDEPPAQMDMDLGRGGGFVQRVQNDLYRPPAQPRPVMQQRSREPTFTVHSRQPVPAMDYDMAPSAPVYVPQILPEHFEDVAPQQVQVRQAPPPQQQHVDTYMMPSYRKTVHTTPTQKMHSAPVVTDIVSPTQGFRVLITNLHPVVTEEDVVELFSVAGSLRKARLIRPGIGEVVYSTREEAIGAIRKYHNRELDGMPMSVQLASVPVTKKIPAAVRLEQRLEPSPPPPVQKIHRPPPAATLPTEQAQAPEQPQAQRQQDFQPLKLFKPSAGSSSSQSSGDNIDVGAIHKALFKTKEPGPSKPVTFTVKI